MEVYLEFVDGKKQVIKNVIKTFNGLTLILITIKNKIEQLKSNPKEIKYMHVFGDI